ncbi:hypothetical protein LUX57_18435 [Actinomadura madurae]|nr:hypothetical protein [Actinomadura madurae]MCP9966850.1 hypothetical protein [Actinomadura madurae]
MNGANEWARPLMIKHVERMTADLTEELTGRDTWRELGGRPSSTTS